MTYCAALKLDTHLIFMSDTRTNAGVDNVARYKKMFTWSEPGDRVITVLTAGNLATTQAVISLLEERGLAPEDRNPGLMQATTMFQAVGIIAETLREVVTKTGAVGPDGLIGKSPFGATLIVGGQIRGMKPRLFMVYPEGNFVEAEADTPFFQSGETKYGRPIILRAFDPTMSVEDAMRLLCVSFDSTLRANLSVGMPLDAHIYAGDSFEVGQTFRIDEDDTAFQDIARAWGEALKSALETLPHYPL